jgi:hypothetical protein
LEIDDKEGEVGYKIDWYEGELDKDGHHGETMTKMEKLRGIKNFGAHK